MNNLWQRNQHSALHRMVVNPTSILVIALALILALLGIAVSMVERAPVIWMVGLALAFVMVAGRFITARRPGTERRKERSYSKEYDIEGIASPHLRKLLTQTYAYRERYVQALNDLPTPLSEPMQLDIVSQLESCVAQFEELERKLDLVSNNSEFMSDLKDVPLSIEQLQQQIANADNELVRLTLEKMLARRERRAAELNRVAQSMDDAEVALEETMTALGTQYSHILMFDTRSGDKVSIQSLSQALSEQEKLLQAQCDSLDQALDAVNGTPVPQAIQAEPSLRSQTGSEL